MVVNNYSPRSLSYDADRLPAISGTAALFHQRLNCRYLAGLWEAGLPWNLCWNILSATLVGCAPAEYLAPTWSWASVTQSIQMGSALVILGSGGRAEPSAAVLDVRCDVLGLNPFGRVDSGHLRLRGRLVNAFLCGANTLYPTVKTSEGRAGWLIAVDCALALDPGGSLVRANGDPSTAVDGAISCLLIGTLFPSDFEPVIHEALALVPSLTNPSAFCRVGRL